VSAALVVATSDAAAAAADDDDDDDDDVDRELGFLENRICWLWAWPLEAVALFLNVVASNTSGNCHNGGVLSELIM